MYRCSGVIDHSKDRPLIHPHSSTHVHSPGTIEMEVSRREGRSDGRVSAGYAKLKINEVWTICSSSVCDIVESIYATVGAREQGVRFE